MKATTPRGGGVETAKPKKRKKAGAGGFIFGCGGSKSVAVVADNLSTMALAKSSSSSSAAAMAKPAPAAKPTALACQDAEGAPSVDALLGQLRELERGVRALGVRAREEDGVAQACRCSAGPPRHRRDAWGGGRGRLEEESVAVVTETEDPLGEFRRSMAEMVVENGITGGAELRELLQRFLSLNSARHHHLILRAFADVWEELFAGDPTQMLKQKQKRPAVSPAGHSARASS
ncbi:uncharacterized protein LOC119298356 [Triticum dicoccoides]|uniref:uncharacterized protein LOC119298356 n=1 Tax=Triticum dicoccoides TaxID=85692 RepID=UPI000E78D6CD|nr:uncharacterized protein LOC119298356 [Triticum dicoccoides]